jgi:hypothetical protein
MGSIKEPWTRRRVGFVGFSDEELEALAMMKREYR